MLRVRRGVISRLLHVDGAPVLVHAWQRRDGEVVLRAVPAARHPGADGSRLPGDDAPVGDACLRLAIERMRFALGVDDDYRELYAEFRRDRLLGSAIRRLRWHRPRRRPWPWEALAWSVTKQLIESSRAAQIQRRMVFRWGERWTASDGATLRDVPTAVTIAARAPAELAGTDLAPARALALIRAAREVAAGRVDPARATDDRRLLAIREIGPWTVQCLGLYGRAEPDSLPAGDLGFIKLVGRLAGLGRRATIEEVEDFFAPYAPYRGIAGSFVLAAHYKAVAVGPPLRLAA